MRYLTSLSLEAAALPDLILVNRVSHPPALPSAQDKNPLHIIRRMTTPDGIYVLYKDVPRRRYRRIAAKSEESPSHLQFFVEITEGEPFEYENGKVQIVLCSTRSEAMAKAEQERESSLNSGWREYPDAHL